jgi:ribonuclease D
LSDAARKICLHRGDLPAGLSLGPVVAIDSETMGLNPWRDRLCLVQLSAGDGEAHLVQFDRGPIAAPRLKALLGDQAVLKLMHFARFDLAMILNHLGVMARPVYCTKTASRLARTMTDRHGLKDLCKDLLAVDLSKQQQMSDWGGETLSDEQLAYAASDVLHLHALKAKLDGLLLREGRLDLARACFDFLPHRAALDLAGWAENDIFAH